MKISQKSMTSGIFILLLIAALTPNTVQSATGTDYDLSTLPIGFSQYVQSGNEITFNGTGMIIKALANTYAHIQTTVNESVNYIETKLHQINGSSGVSWAPSIGLHWNNDTMLTFGVGAIGDIAFIFSYTKVNDQYSENGLNFPLAFNESIYLRVFIVDNKSVELEFSVGSGLWIDYNRYANVLTGNHIDTFDLQPQGIDPSNVNVMLGKGFLPGYNEFVTHDNSSYFDAYYNIDTGVIGYTFFEYLKFNSSVYETPEVPTVITNINDTETSTVTTTDTELVIQNNTVTITETETNDSNGVALNSPFNTINLFVTASIFMVVYRLKSRE